MDTCDFASKRSYPVGMKRKNKQGAQPPDPAKLAPKASAGDLTLHTRVIGVLPIIERLRLKQTLDQFLPTEDRLFDVNLPELAMAVTVTENENARTYPGGNRGRNNPCQTLDERLDRRGCAAGRGGLS